MYASFLFRLSMCAAAMLYLAAPGPVWWVSSTNMLSFPLGAWQRDEQHRHYQVSFLLSLHFSLSLSLSAHIFQRSIITPPRSPCLLPLRSFPPTLPLCLSTLAQSLSLTPSIFPPGSAASAAVGVPWQRWRRWQQRWWGGVYVGVSPSFKGELGKPIQIAY